MGGSHHLSPFFRIGILGYLETFVFLLRGKVSAAINLAPLSVALGAKSRLIKKTMLGKGSSKSRTSLGPAKGNKCCCDPGLTAGRENGPQWLTHEERNLLPAETVAQWGQKCYYNATKKKVLFCLGNTTRTCT